MLTDDYKLKDLVYKEKRLIRFYKIKLCTVKENKIYKKALQVNIYIKTLYNNQYTRTICKHLTQLW